MSEDKKAPSVVGQFVYAFDFNRRITKFFQSVGGTGTCEACGANEWIQIPGNPKYVLAQAARHDQGLELMAICCANCGNTRFFNWDRIVHFLRQENEDHFSPRAPEESRDG